MQCQRRSRGAVFYSMMASSNGNIFRVTGPLCGEFTGHRPVNSLTKASDVELWCFLGLHPNKRLSKQSWGLWFGTPSRSLWRHCNAISLQNTAQTQISPTSLSYLTNHVVYNGHKSESQVIRCGVPQGSILRGLFFSLVYHTQKKINDLTDVSGFLVGGCGHQPYTTRLVRRPAIYTATQS